MISFATKHNDPDAKLAWSERIGFGTGGFAFNMINGIIGSFLTIYFTNVAYLDPGIIATIIAVSKLFDGISDLIVGNLVDRTKSPLGKGRSWVLRMCIPFGISAILLFFVPSSFPTMLKYVYVFLMYNLVNAVFLTAMQVPYYSMISLITKNPYERGMLGNVQQIFQTLGNIVVNSFFVAMLTKFTSDPTAQNIYTQRAFTITMIIFCSIMVIASLICVICSKERVNDSISEKKDGKKDDTNPIAAVKALFTNRYWVILTLAMFVIFFVIIFYSIGGVYYCMYVFKDMGNYPWMSNAISIAQFASMFAVPILMVKFPKSTVYKFGLALMLVGFVGFGFVEGSKTAMIIMNILKGCGLGFSGGMALGLVADTITYGSMKSGINVVGMGNAGVSAAQKLGLGLGTAVFGWTMSLTGFDAQLDVQGLPQPDSVVNAIRFVYNWIPAIMIGVVLVLMILLFNIEKALENVKAEG
ncbi:MAG: MFS transporter [Blautia sp.]|nr:MFS transporter [Blautia sp.]